MTTLDTAILEALAAWCLDELQRDASELTLITADNSRLTFRREGRSGTPYTFRTDWLFARWERALQFAERDRALAAGEPIEPDQPAVPPYRPTYGWG
jgi:hypothetical protein